jgi:hypothetical protein
MKENSIFQFFTINQSQEPFNTIHYSLAKLNSKLFLTTTFFYIFLVYFLRDNTEKAEVSGIHNHWVIQFEGEVVPTFLLCGQFPVEDLSAEKMPAIILLDEGINPEFTPKILLTDD